MCNLNQYFNSSIGKKQIVATTGLLLILFVVGHLAGNLIIYLGPEAFNNYAKKLAGLRPGLYFVEVGLALVFLTHILVTALLIIQNIKARPVGYRVYGDSGERSFATRLMPYTGTFLLIFIIWHLFDFTFIDKHGSRSMLMGHSYGLFGVVYNSFVDPIHSLLYILAMCCLGFHLGHGIESFAQTFGCTNLTSTPLIKRISYYSALIITVAYSSIPVYVFFSYPILK